nr:MAG: hypothetical protein [Feral pigeon parvovirus A]
MSIEMAVINKTKEACVMQWKEKLGCAEGTDLRERCDKFEYREEKYIWPPNSTKYCNHKKDWVVIGERYCLRTPYGTELKECLGPNPRIVDVFSECCPVTGLL